MRGAGTAEVKVVSSSLPGIIISAREREQLFGDERELFVLVSRNIVT
jgi:hypothetical protein